MPVPIKIGLSPKLKIRGVIANKNFNEEDVIEKCPMLLINRKYEKLIDQTPLTNYYFEWDKKHLSILLGYGCLYNHSYKANAKLKEDFDNNVMIITAAKEIKKGSEITINYNGFPSSRQKLAKNYLSFDKTS